MSEFDSVSIGHQVWMAKNLSVIHFQNGDPIPEVRSPEDWETAGIEGMPAFCYYNNNPDDAVLYGVLYNQFALKDLRGLAPQGWRIPVRKDWDELIRHLGGQKIAGRKMKSVEFWLDTVNGMNGNGTNESGFNAYPSGERNFIGNFHHRGLTCSWWCAVSNADEEECFYYLDHEKTSIETGIFDPEDGLAIRCVK